MFLASLVGDIVRGMCYLHESVFKNHGNLKTSNCLIDSRWVLKISDFGLKHFKDHEETALIIQQVRVNTMFSLNIFRNFQHPELSYDYLYTAPECLRNPSSVSDKSDVYSFAIILYEMHSRAGPFGESQLSDAEILRKIIKPDEELYFRPQLDLLENCMDFVKETIRICWSESPDLRPDFKSIRNKLRPLRKGMKANIFDNMITMMETYANNLEAIVDERTKMLIDEKRKTDELLYEMLPKYVAEQLKMGQKVDPESFDLVTIYFSDIVGFTGMVADATPLEVIDFLNELYTCFDSIIDSYDVYKVETIGDAYMVVSGLPVR